MSQQELLERVIAELDRLQVPYMLTGSLASSLQGEPRATHDIDLVVELWAEAGQGLVQAFSEPDYYLSEAAIRNALLNQSMFNLIDVRGGDKVDFWILTDEPFDRARFARRRPETVFGTTMMVSSPEDTILMKLRWAKQSGGSRKQFGDALRVYEVQHPDLDRDYLERWVWRLSIRDLWLELLEAARPWCRPS